ncbi:hypothetical protein LXA43DRAFT_1066311 [Ganoderma leucocontextum]|nr:hypothetical protein LXA43DRAFT_1066311 [Ganoderma leucocontextum]
MPSHLALPAPSGLPSLPAPPGLAALPGLALHDLSNPPVDVELDRFVRELHSAGYHYDLSRVPDVIDEFLLRFRALHMRFVTCVDLDDYFRATYRFLLGQPEGERASPNVLRKFWEDYSCTSRQQVFDNACEDLRVAEEEHREVYDRYRAILLSCVRGDITAEDDEYKTAIRAHEESLETIQECASCCDLAAHKLAIVRIWGVYQHPQYGNSPLDDDYTIKQQGLTVVRDQLLLEKEGTQWVG